uniref:Uncharacterized protein n=1 Tax=Oryza brachyantha TaxID=4533 RepID=J3MJW4_ORYBR
MAGRIEGICIFPLLPSHPPCFPFHRSFFSTGAGGRWGRRRSTHANTAVLQNKGGAMGRCAAGKGAVAMASRKEAATATAGARNGMPWQREVFTCVPLKKMVPVSVPLKSLVLPLCHRRTLSRPPRHSVAILLGFNR